MQVTASYLELYNETPRDLLAPRSTTTTTMSATGGTPGRTPRKGHLEVRGPRDGAYFVDGLTELRVEGADQATTPLHSTLPYTLSLPYHSER